ncbi:MAG TPA: GDP-mannose 4,6-dehydratase [Gemmatimonadaceae bacterium]|nr:GDP-mannose 4,6-dehydratase [Gemmatimonadaceae bacterium]
MSRVLITGSNGFVGQWLIRDLIQKLWEVHAGVIHWPPKAPLLSPEEHHAVRWTMLDIRSDDEVARAIDDSAPEYIVHLAGIAFAPEANASPVRSLDINALGAARLLTHVARLRAHKPRVLVVGSAEQYGAQPASAYPIAETAPLRPLTSYAAGKAAQELVALQVFRGEDVPIICTRSFNHSGVGHGESYLLPSLIRRVRALPANDAVLPIGNADVVRDYLHVADVVHAYIQLLERGEPGEVYNVCSGEGITVRDLAARVVRRAGSNARVASEESLRRKNDVPILVGDNRKLRAVTGWTPRHSVDDIIDDLLHAATR